MRYRDTITGGFTDEFIVTEQIPGSDPTDYSTSYGGTYHEKSITDKVTSGFFSLKKCGQFLPLNLATMQMFDEQHVPGAVSADVVSNHVKYRGRFWIALSRQLDWPVPSGSLTDAAVLAAASNAAASDFDALTFAAELRKNVSAIGSTGVKLNQLAYRLARKARSFRRDPWKEFRKLWLEARYQWRPMIYDVKSSIKAIDTLYEQNTLVRGRGTQQESDNLEYDSGWQPYGSYYESRHRESMSYSYIHRGVAYIQHSSVSAHAFGADPLVTVWELVPYSFVIDWFINVGAWVQTLRPRLGGQYSGLQYSTKEVCTWEQSFELRGVPGLITGGYSPCRTRQVLTRYHRGPTTIPLPPLLPKLDLPKLVDLVALFAKGRQKVGATLNGY